MICCFFSSFKTFAMLREATYPPALVNVLDVSSESMAAFQVFLYGRFLVFTEDVRLDRASELYVAAAIPLLFSGVVFSVLIYTMWAAIQDGHVRTTPGRAVGFLFIPIYSI